MGQLLQTPAEANKTVPVTIEGTDITFNVPVGTSSADIMKMGQAELQKRATQERVARDGGPTIQQGEKHSTATDVLLGLLPDVGGLAGSMLPGGNLVKALFSILGGAGGEGMRQAIEGEETSPAQMVTSGAFQALPPGAGAVGRLSEG